MNRGSLTIGFFILMMLQLICMLSCQTLPVKSIERAEEPVLGIYNRSDTAASFGNFTLKHFTLVWKGSSAKAISQQLAGEVKKKPSLITIETRTKDPLTQTLNKEFDKEINELAELTSKASQSVYVRWNPDMEVPVHNYPWQYCSPRNYINAFNYVAKKLKQLAPAIKIVWGPSGFPGDTEYWPGGTYVDEVSITLGSASEKVSNAYPYQDRLTQLLHFKLHRMRFINKPVIVIGSPERHTLGQNLLRLEYALAEKYKNTIYSPANFRDSAVTKPKRNKLTIGVFDPKQKLIADPRITAEHLFTDWGEIERGDLGKRFNAIIGRQHDVILTVEPWKDTSKMPDANVLQSTLNGRYDAVIKKLYQIITHTNQTVYLRFAHEMEIPIHRYPWQSQDPVTYINAYRHFMLFDGSKAKNVKRVWGPAGDRGSADWWPGNDVVDYISIAIYGLPDKNITDPNKQESFSTIFHRKYYRMRFLDKPLFITEFGVKGDVGYQTKWLQDAANTLKGSPDVFGACYFNMSDTPNAWGNIKVPDWSITPDELKLFYKELK